MAHHTRSQQISNQITNPVSCANANQPQPAYLNQQDFFQLPGRGSDGFYHAEPADIRRYRNVKNIVNQEIAAKHQ